MILFVCDFGASVYVWNCVICACPFSSHAIRLSLLVHSTYKLHSLSYLYVCLYTCVWPTLFPSKKRKLIKEDTSSMCDDTRIRTQNQLNNENTMAISRKRRKIIRMIDTRVMHMNISDDHLCTCFKIYFCAISTCQNCRKCFAVSENIKTLWNFIYTHMRAPSLLSLFFYVKLTNNRNRFIYLYPRLIWFKALEGAIVLILQKEILLWITIKIEWTVKNLILNFNGK